MSMSEKRKDLLILAGVGFLMVMVTLTLREVANRPMSYSDFPRGVSEGSITFLVENGDSGEEIARNLEKEGVISSWQTFFRLALSDTRAQRIAPGSYLIEKKIPASLALEQLLDIERIQGLITLRDGVRLSEVVSILEKNDYPGVGRAIRDAVIPEPFTLRDPEGFFYPAKYSFGSEFETMDVIKAFIARFQSAMKGVDWEGSDTYSPDQLLIIASLIEAEGTPDVFEKVSRVIHNRLQKGMPLQLDSTVHYIQNSRGNIALSLNETKINSPYNTYQRRGLPPGPIGSPTRAAVDAAISPAEGEWLYFITVAPSDTRFTSSYDEFLRWKALYRENYRNGAFDD